MTKEFISDFFLGLQDEICRSLELADGGGSFVEEPWNHHSGGGGRTRIIQNGQVIERGGVNYSGVEGILPKKIQEAMNLPESAFFATGVSIVIHPFNPFVPIIHMNVRYFELENGTYWFGGGIDLTPHYYNASDADYFHSGLKKVCDRFHPTYYSTFKSWADRYFYLPHRGETRGIGGIFFDKLIEDATISKDQIFNFVKAVGEFFAPTYCHFMEQHKSESFTEAHKEFQLLRRSRYVEFNLLYDLGTKFGLETGGRTESILMSMPPMAKWVYGYEAKAGSSEEKTMAVLRGNG